MKRWPILFILLLLAGYQTWFSQPAWNPGNAYTDQGNYPDYGGGAKNEPVKPDEDFKYEIDLEAVRPNEAGKVMILMYHDIGLQESAWVRTVQNFRQDMLLLYKMGYRPINLTDFLNGYIDVPAGTTPFILTFDDGTAGQFRFIERDGKLIPDPDCAVAILLEMAKTHDDFYPSGTFYINYPNPFAQRSFVPEKLRLLAGWGFEIGNHTYNHEDLSRVSREEGIRTLAKHVQATQQILPGYQVNTLALPYGARPADGSYLIRGTYNGWEYHNRAVLLAGAKPARSPFDHGFNPLSLPRVRADGTEMYRWLNHFNDQPQDRYISDGDPGTVTVPEKLAGRIDKSRLGHRILRLY